MVFRVRQGSKLESTLLTPQSEQWRIAAIERKNLRDAVLSYLNEHPSKKEQKAIEALQQCRDFSMLEKTLVEEKQKWFENRKLGGKPQDLFHRMCSTLEGHQSILSAFPDSNIYVSIFCAAFKTVIRVSQSPHRYKKGDS